MSQSVLVHLFQMPALEIFVNRKSRLADDVAKFKDGCPLSHYSAPFFAPCALFCGHSSPHHKIIMVEQRMHQVLARPLARLDRGAVRSRNERRPVRLEHLPLLREKLTR